MTIQERTSGVQAFTRERIQISTIRSYEMRFGHTWGTCGESISARRGAAKNLNEQKIFKTPNFPYISVENRK
jgi:hypothetical protein